MNFDMIMIGAKQLRDLAIKNSPTILTGFGVSGVVATAILTGKAVPKAMRILQDEADRRYNQWEEETGEDASAYPVDVLTSWEKVQLTWHCYIPAILTGTTTITCIIFANSINLRRNAALASLYTVTETTLREYQAKVVEQIGEKKEAKIRDEIAKDQLANNPPTNIIVTKKGTTLFYDTLSARHFLSDIDVVDRAVNDLNREIRQEGYVTVNQLYIRLGLEPIELGVSSGWTPDYWLEVIKNPQINKENEVEIVLSYQYTPRPL